MFHPSRPLGKVIECRETAHDAYGVSNVVEIVMRGLIFLSRIDNWGQCDRLMGMRHWTAERTVSCSYLVDLPVRCETLGR